MTRTGLLIALAIAAGVGLVFAIFPQLDIEIARVMLGKSHPVNDAMPRWTVRSLLTTGTYVRPNTVYGRLANLWKGSSRGTASGIDARFSGTRCGGPSSE